MPSFCPNCAAALDPDAKFCPACSSPVAYAAGGGGYPGGQYPGAMGQGAQRGAAFNMPATKIEPLVWAGVISLFWAAWFYTKMAGLGGIMDLGFAAAGARGGGDPDTAGIFVLLSAAFSVMAFAVMAAVTYGILKKKRWAYSLFMLAVGPIALIWLILSLVTFLTTGSKPAGLVIITILGYVVGLGLFGLQAMMMMKNRHLFTE